MNKELKRIDYIINSAGRIIDDPSKSLKEETGIYKDSSGNWRYAQSAALLLGATAGGFAIVSSTIIAPIGTVVGLSAGAGLAAAGGGLSATGVGIVVGGVLLGAGGILLIRAKKKAAREKEEKDRMYREIIAKQQAAINKQKEINRQLEEQLRQANDTNASNQQNIEYLKQQIVNLQEVIELLTEQLSQFKNAA